VGWDKPHLSVRVLLGAGLFLGDVMFGGKTQNEEKYSWYEKHHVRGKRARHACRET